MPVIMVQQCTYSTPGYKIIPANTVMVYITTLTINQYHQLYSAIVLNGLLIALVKT